jgi:hypothetical protein
MMKIPCDQKNLDLKKRGQVLTILKPRHQGGEADPPRRGPRKPPRNLQGQGNVEDPLESIESSRMMMTRMITRNKKRQRVKMHHLKKSCLKYQRGGEGDPHVRLQL